MSGRSETLRNYAAIFDRWTRDPISKDRYPPTGIAVAAAEALRFQADSLERDKEIPASAGVTAPAG